MGAKLGTLFARAGHDVFFSYSRSERKLQDLAKKTGGKSGTPRKAVEAADVLLLSVNWPQMDDVLKQSGDLSGKTILSCSLLCECEQL